MIGQCHIDFDLNVKTDSFKCLTIVFKGALGRVVWEGWWWWWAIGRLWGKGLQRVDKIKKQGKESSGFLLRKVK